MNLGVAVLSGLVIGGFLNVVIHRIPLGRSVVWLPYRGPARGETISGNVRLFACALLGGPCLRLAGGA